MAVVPGGGVVTCRELLGCVACANRERQAAFYSAVAEAEADMLAQLRALPLETEADRATMGAFVPLAKRMIELHRQQAEAAAAGDHKRLNELLGERVDLTHRMDQILFCMIRLGA
jgi:hypothetical protein